MDSLHTIEKLGIYNKNCEVLCIFKQKETKRTIVFKKTETEGRGN